MRKGRRSKTDKRDIVPRPQKRLSMRVLSAEDCERIHAAALRIMRERGLRVYDKETRDILIRRGCRDGGDDFVRFDDDLVATALSTVPRNLVLYDRDGAVAVDTAGDLPRFSPGQNCRDILDHRTGEHRPYTLHDIAEVGRLCQQLKHIDVAAGLGYPADVEAEEEGLATVRALLENTRKPIVFIGHDDVEVDRIWALLADWAGGMEALAERPFAMDTTGPVSPLKISSEACRRVRGAARRRLPVVWYPALFPGMAAPITLAGSLAQCAAEVLAGVVIHQIEGPGSPIITGSAILPMDLRRADIAYGSPEYSLAGLAQVDYFGHIGLPTWIGAGCSDANVMDSQAAAEASMNMSMATLSGTRFIHNLGYLSAGRLGSLEMLVLCDELAAMACKLAAGVVVDETTLAAEVVLRAGAENTYLTDQHTLERYATEMWFPSIFQRSEIRVWQEAGAPNTSGLIRERLDSLLG